MSGRNGTDGITNKKIFCIENRQKQSRNRVRSGYVTFVMKNVISGIFRRSRICGIIIAEFRK